MPRTKIDNKIEKDYCVKGNVTIPDKNDLTTVSEWVVMYFDNEIKCDKILMFKELKSKSNIEHIEFYIEFKSLNSIRTESQKFKDYLKNNSIDIDGKSNMYCFAEVKNPVSAKSYCCKDGNKIYSKDYTDAEIQAFTKSWVKKEAASISMVDKICENYAKRKMAEPLVTPKDLWDVIVNQYEQRGKPFGDHQLVSVFNICCLKLYPSQFHKYTDKLFKNRFEDLSFY